MPNRYVNNIGYGDVARPPLSNGAPTFKLVIGVAKAAGDTDGNVLRLTQVSSHLVVSQLDIRSSANMAGNTDTDLGFYRVNGGAEYDKDVLMDGQTFATALTEATGRNLGLSNVSIANRNKRIYELLGFTDLSNDKPDAVDLAWTLNTGGTAAADVLFTVELTGA